MVSADQILVDIKSGFRQLSKRPAIYAGSVLAIAFAIGVSLTVFCAFRAVFLQPPPYSNREGLVSIEKFDANHWPFLSGITTLTFLGNIPGPFQDWLCYLGIPECKLFPRVEGVRFAPSVFRPIYFRLSV